MPTLANVGLSRRTFLGQAIAGLIDEVSLLVAPVADGRVGTPALLDVDGESAIPGRLVLQAVEQRADGVVWLRYRVGSR